MALRLAVGTEAFREYWARDLNGESVTGLTASDFSISLRKKGSGDSQYVTASETVSVVEIDRANLPGQYEFRFTPMEAASYILEVVPTYTDNTGDSFRADYDVRQEIDLDLEDDFCTREQVLRYIGEKNASAAAQELIDELIPRVTKIIQGAIGRTIFEATKTWDLDPNGASKLVLPEYPVSAIANIWETTSVPRTYDDTTLLTEGEDYIADLDSGIVARIGSTWPSGPATVRIQATVGFAEVPADINSAAVRMVGLLFMQRSRLGQSSESRGDASSAFYDWRQWPVDIVETIERYRNKAFAA